jgi:hypothetical protein
LCGNSFSSNSGLFPAACSSFRASSGNFPFIRASVWAKKLARRICQETLRYASKYCWALVAQTRNPSYSGGRDQEDRGSKPDWQIILEILSQKTQYKKEGLVEWLKV